MVIRNVTTSSFRSRSTKKEQSYSIMCTWLTRDPALVVGSSLAPVKDAPCRLLRESHIKC